MTEHDDYCDPCDQCKRRALDAEAETELLRAIAEAAYACHLECYPGPSNGGTIVEAVIPAAKYTALCAVLNAWR